jgi:Na+/phosphate symporter
MAISCDRSCAASSESGHGRQRRRGLAIALQSATAVALLVGSFVGSGIVGGTSGLLAALGADLGSSIVVKLLSFDLSLLVPICLVAGTVLFMTTSDRKWLQLGRIFIGIGLLILSLRLIGEASHPARQPIAAGNHRLSRQRPDHSLHRGGDR